jgi:hypothetical protein
MKVYLTAVARNEAAGLADWAAHAVAIGFDRIILYDNESTDGTGAVARALSRVFPIELREQACEPGRSPQFVSYNDAVRRHEQDCDWMAFFDLDEFLVVKRAGQTLHEVLSALPPEAVAVGVNWLTFGSGGREARDYALVTEAFRTGGARTWKNNRHIKTIARPPAVAAMLVHHAVLRHGRYVRPGGEPLAMTRPGVAEHVDHSDLQLHHYQVKSLAEFRAKMARGRAGMAADDPNRVRKDPEAFLRAVDRNDHRYDDAEAHRLAFEAAYRRATEALAAQGLLRDGTPKG